jgi:hypothetical protein
MRTNRRSGRIHPWEQAYRDRIAKGLEACRICGRKPPAHVRVVRIKSDGLRTPGNSAIMCSRDVQAMRRGEIPQPQSLAAEERAAPAEQRWAEIAQVESRAARGIDMRRCAACEVLRELDQNGRFRDHLAKGISYREVQNRAWRPEELCPGSRQRPEFVT